MAGGSLHLLAAAHGLTVPAVRYERSDRQKGHEDGEKESKAWHMVAVCTRRASTGCGKEPQADGLP